MKRDDFIRKWSKSSKSEGAERRWKDTFLLDLCEVLGVEKPGDTDDEQYVFEADVRRPRESGGSTTRKIDLYKPGSFILEAKQKLGSESKKAGTKRETAAWENEMRDGLLQAVNYAKWISASNTRPPPFIIVCDIGYAFDIYVHNGSFDYGAFPGRHRIHLRNLTEEDLDTLRRIWNDPQSLLSATPAAKRDLRWMNGLGRRESSRRSTAEVRDCTVGSRLPRPVTLTLLSERVPEALSNVSIGRGPSHRDDSRPTARS